jgi:hypothetical protein
MNNEGNKQDEKDWEKIQREKNTKNSCFVAYLMTLFNLQVFQEYRWKNRELGFIWNEPFYVMSYYRILYLK